MGHEERFPPIRLSAGCGFRKETIARMRRNGRDASSAVIPALALERGSSTLSGHSARRIKSRTPPPLDFPERWNLCLAAWTQRNPAGAQRSPADPVPFYLICHCCVSDSLQLAKYSTLSASGDANVLSRH
jgi:hypothetical protein